MFCMVYDSEGRVLIEAAASASNSGQFVTESVANDQAILAISCGTKCRVRIIPWDASDQTEHTSRLLHVLGTHATFAVSCGSNSAALYAAGTRSAIGAHLLHDNGVL
eukprot:gnl/TRDRNA2_/TRDRNA2_177672_c0_seq2.p2 gnl/TRDRNA2_/TRDRNA2_177672_c0~~gnl/TRDRNA2_/TRDRNA2_177672_c0_seq2.p2  ORF type:complete len:107 (-),score=8.31 gnl/TRDRNA2_/TRDRNA2_177672_c0_seq2:295-615(-)